MSAQKELIPCPVKMAMLAFLQCRSNCVCMAAGIAHSPLQHIQNKCAGIAWRTYGCVRKESYEFNGM